MDKFSVTNLAVGTRGTAKEFLAAHTREFLMKQFLISTGMRDQMMRNRRVTVQWYDDEFEAHFLDMPVPITYNRKDIDVAVDKELLGRGVADYRWNIADDISHVLVNKITDLLEKENWRYRIIQDFDSVFSFELTNYYQGYVYFKVDLIEFTTTHCYIADVGSLTNREKQNVDKFSAALKTIIRKVKRKFYL